MRFDLAAIANMQMHATHVNVGACHHRRMECCLELMRLIALIRLCKCCVLIYLRVMLQYMTASSASSRRVCVGVCVCLYGTIIHSVVLGAANK